MKANETSQSDAPVRNATDSRPTSQRRSPTFGGDTKAASYPVDNVDVDVVEVGLVDNVHQARIAMSVVGWGMNLEDCKKRDRLRSAKVCRGRLQ